ncbi:MAG: relaxase [Pseudomonadota bacterium]
MILKGSQRGGGQNLAVHLLRADENEHVEVHEIRGFASEELHLAFKEAQAVSTGTKCRQYLFSLSLNPPETENVPVEIFEQAIDRIEQNLGLTDQPRAIVFHEKEGRRHAHCVWSRIDSIEMKAKQLSHFKRKLTDISRELYLEHNWTMPRGLENPALRDPTNFSLAEWQQAKRTNIDPREIKSAIQKCWETSDGRATFGHALQECGVHLARGDRRGFVAVDYNGEVYSLTRALNVKSKDIIAKLGDPSDLKSVQDTKMLIAERVTPALKRHIVESRISFKHRLATFDHAKTKMRDQHRTARNDLKELQSKRDALETRQRANRFRKGLRGLWDRVTGHHRNIKKQNEAEAIACKTRDAQERQTLVTYQLSERRILQSKIKISRRRQAEILRDLRIDIGRYIIMSRGSEPLPQRQRRRRRATRELRL